MEWIFYALAAMTFFSIANVTDKVLLTHRVKNPFLPVIVDMILGLIFAVAIFLFYGIGPLSGTLLALAIGLGILNVAIYSAYFKSLQSEEVSRIVPLYLLSNFVIFFLSITFLGRVFSFWQVGGAALILGGAFLVTQHDFRKIRLSKGVLFALAGTFMSSLFIVASDYLLQGVSVETFFVYTRTSSFIASLALIWIYRKDFSKMVLNPSRHGFGIIVFSESITVVGAFLGMFAIKGASGALYNAVLAAQSLVVLLLTIGLSFFLPHILKEKINPKTILQKLTAIVLIIGGIWLLK